MVKLEFRKFSENRTLAATCGHRRYHQIRRVQKSF
jgi:hypothetical protein